MTISKEEALKSYLKLRIQEEIRNLEVMKNGLIDDIKELTEFNLPMRFDFHLQRLLEIRQRLLSLRELLYKIEEQSGEQRK